jgi:hypothetical protein
MIEINYNDVINTDISFLEKYYLKIGHVESSFRNTLPQNEHYKLLTYLSFQFNDSLILDLGTFDGMSAICLAQNPTNRVISYDIVDKDFSDILRPIYVNNTSMEILNHTPFGKEYPNISFKNLDIINEDVDVLNSSVFMLLDISHNGEDERNFMNKIKQTEFDGYILCDDIRTDIFPLRDWFDSLEWSKYDLTEVGHSTGSGLLDIGGRGVRIIK